MGQNDPLWRSYIFPAWGLVADITILFFKGFPATIWLIAAVVVLVVGCVWIYTDKESGGGESMLPYGIATAGPLLILILSLAI